MKHLEYIEKASCIHDWDPRIKILSLFFCIFAASFSTSIPSLFLLLILSIAIILLSRIKITHYLTTIKYPLYLLFFIIPLLTISSGGTALFSFGIVTVYKEGLNWSLIIFLRIVSIIGLFSSLFLTTKYNRIFKSLEFFFIPNTIIQIFLTTYRFIFLFFDYLENSRNAARLRGLNIKNSIRNINVSIGILTSLLIRGLEQSEICYKSMRLRGFNDKINLLSEFHIKAADFIKMLVIVITITAIFLFG